MAAHAVAQETLFVLRQKIAKIEGALVERLAPADHGVAHEAGIVLRYGGIPGTAAVLRTGAARFDAALGGGVPLAALTEIHGKETRDAGAVAGFSLALSAAAMRQAGGKPLLWIAAADSSREAGVPYAPGLLQRFGILPAALYFSEIRKVEDALWIAEEAAALAGFAAILLEIRGTARKLDLTATRRLHRRAQMAGRPFYLLRQAGQPEPTAAPVRLVVSPAPAGERRHLWGTLPGSIGPPAFAVEIAKNSFASPAKFTLEWNQDDRTLHERPETGTPDIGAVVSPSSERPDSAAKAGQVMAFKGAA